MRRVPTGIRTLDELMEGGLPKPASIGLVGEVGSGKSIVCNQIAWNVLQQDFQVLYYTIDESVEDVKESMGRFGWDVEPFEKKGKIRFVDVFSAGMATILEKTKAEKIEEIAVEADKMGAIPISLREMIQEGKEYYFKAIFGKDLLIIFDSVTPLFLTVDHNEVFRFLRSASYACRISKGIGIATLHAGIHGAHVENACKQIADGVIEIRKFTEGGTIRRSVRVEKMTKTKIFEEYCPMEITDSGIVVHRIPVTYSLKTG